MIEKVVLLQAIYGGHGATYLSHKHPELFCAAGSMSGVADMEV
jgi:S-formylglutathione hydrolase FrmB